MIPLRGVVLVVVLSSVVVEVPADWNFLETLLRGGINADSVEEGYGSPNVLHRIAYDPATGIEVYSNQVTWAQARKACQALNKDLISVENSTQIEYLRRLLPIELHSYSERYWIGGHTKLKNPGRGWYWVNSLRQMPWRPIVGAPPIPKDQTDEECAEVEYKHKPKQRLRVLYGDDDCSTPLAYVCSVRQMPLEKQK